jgi:L-rhamnonate dehydratase
MIPARIVEVRAYVDGAQNGAADYHRQSQDHWINNGAIATPMSRYGEYKSSRSSWGLDVLGTVIVEIELADGTCGFGISIGGEPACYLIERHFSRFLIGQDPRNVELLWDQMWRASLYYGRKGLAINAISAVVLALWDLLGKMRQEPVYALLGGKSKAQLPVYVTTCQPQTALSQPFFGLKVPLRHGPADGETGLKSNVRFLSEAREQIGADLPLMVDCYMSLDLPYAIALGQALEKLNLYWLEECLPPDDIDGYARLKAALPHCRITTGEHEYTRYGFRELISRRCVDVLQPDVNWAGGITEVRRIVAMAAAYDIPVVPHGSSVFSYHLQYAFQNCPFGEFLVMSRRGDEIVPVFGDLFKNEPLPKEGCITLSEAPGWGVELNRATANLRRPYQGQKTEQMA